MPAQGGAYVEGIAGFPFAINPLMVAYNEAGPGYRVLVFSGLTRLNARGEVEPGSWPVKSVSTGRAYIHFSPSPWCPLAITSFLTADDVLFTVRMLRTRILLFPSDLRNLWSTVQAVAEDDLTVRFVLAETFRPSPGPTRRWAFCPPTSWKTYRPPIYPAMTSQPAPIRHGPFQVEAVDLEGRITLSSCGGLPLYYGPRPYLERGPASAASLRSERLPGLPGQEKWRVAQVPLEVLPSGPAGGEVEPLTPPPSPDRRWFSWNLGKKEELPFFQEKEVRQALMYGLGPTGAGG